MAPYKDGQLQIMHILQNTLLWIIAIWNCVYFTSIFATLYVISHDNVYFFVGLPIGLIIDGLQVNAFRDALHQHAGLHREPVVTFEPVPTLHDMRSKYVRPNSDGLTTHYGPHFTNGLIGAGILVVPFLMHWETITDPIYVALQPLYDTFKATTVAQSFWANNLERVLQDIYTYKAAAFAYFVALGAMFPFVYRQSWKRRALFRLKPKDERFRNCVLDALVSLGAMIYFARSYEALNGYRGPNAEFTLYLGVAVTFAFTFLSRIAMCELLTQWRLIAENEAASTQQK